MIKVDIKLGNKSWELKESLNLNTFDHDHFNSAIKSIQKQTNGILTQLVEEESSTGDNKEISGSYKLISFAV